MKKGVAESGGRCYNGPVEKRILKRGRPNKYSENLMNAAVAEVRKGRTLTCVAREFRLPISTVWSWFHKENTKTP